MHSARAADGRGHSCRHRTVVTRRLAETGHLKVLSSRTMYPTIPPRVDYELTELGKTLLEPVMAFNDALLEGLKEASGKDGRRN